MSVRTRSTGDGASGMEKRPAECDQQVSHLLAKNDIPPANLRFPLAASTTSLKPLDKHVARCGSRSSMFRLPLLISSALQ